MPDIALLLVFLPTFFFVSITPGMCMTLAMTLGMTIGIKKTMWMMLGELIGVGAVAVASVMGVATVMLSYPEAFSVVKYLGGAYLGFIGIQMWLSKGKMTITNSPNTLISRKDLFMQGIITAVSNPKGWAFMISLLPPFIDANRDIGTQLFWLVSIILVSEFVSMMAYATGGKTLRVFLSNGDNIKTLNRIAGTLMVGVGVWLAIG